MSSAKMMMKKNKHKIIKLMNHMKQTSVSFSFILHYVNKLPALQN